MSSAEEDAQVVTLHQSDLWFPPLAEDTPPRDSDGYEVVWKGKQMNLGVAFLCSKKFQDFVKASVHSNYLSMYLPMNLRYADLASRGIHPSWNLFINDPSVSLPSVFAAIPHKRLPLKGNYFGAQCRFAILKHGKRLWRSAMPERRLVL